MLSSLSTAMTMFSGLVSVGMFRAFGSCTGTFFNTTGTVMRKMISITSITSTSGVVLIVVFRSASSESAEWTEIDILYVLRVARCALLLVVGDQVGLKIAREAAKPLI